MTAGLWMNARSRNHASTRGRPDLGQDLLHLLNHRPCRLLVESGSGSSPDGHGVPI